MTKLIGAMLLATAAPCAAWAQVATPSQAALDPARVAAARELMDILLPPASRDQMMQGMIVPLMTNLRQGMTQNPQFQATMRSDPRIKPMFDQFVARQEARTTALMRDALPGMVPAMANAYARRFDLQQLRDLRTFFETPTGRAYMQASFTIMSDPDIAAWQRQTMAQSMSHIQEDIATFARQVAALEKKP